MAGTEPLLQVRDLGIEFDTPAGPVIVVEDVSFDVHAGDVMGLVGESGSGKTVTSMALLGLIRHLGGRLVPGSSVRFEGEELTAMKEAEINRIRGARIGMIFQQPVRSLDPAYTVGDQIAETIRQHEPVRRRHAWDRAVTLLDQVQIPEPARRARQYPHELSGGMCQRVMIAMALSCSPSLLIADEPTTALDVTVQSQVLDLLRQIQEDTGIAILFVSHDLGVIAEICDSVAVMYAGHVVEVATAENLFRKPQHPYAEGLLRLTPKLGQGKRLAAIAGNVPDPAHFPAGCRFHPRCAYAVAGRCDTAVPPLERPGDRAVRCVRSDEIDLSGVLRPT